MLKKNKKFIKEEEYKTIIPKRRLKHLPKNIKKKFKKKLADKKNISKAIIFIIIFLLTFGLIVLFTFSYFNVINNHLLIYSSNITKFYEIFPKIDLQKNKKIKNIKDIFNGRELFISDINLTGEYIQFIRPINEEEEKNYTIKIYEDLKPRDYKNATRPSKQYSVSEYYELCIQEKLINEEKFETNKEPLISIVVVSFNKEKSILKSIRSIQNQSLKNIEIIIVDDCSTDNSTNIIKYLLNNDSRIRVFYHLKNLGVWRSRLDGFLYSKAKYIIHFDMGDCYADNYILEDSYNLITKYQLDSVRFSFITAKNKFSNDSKTSIQYYKRKDTKIVYGKKNYDLSLFSYGTIWNRLTRANIITKGLYSFNSYMLNAYKNMWEDRCWNQLINENSFSTLMVNRVGYLYILENNGEGLLRAGDKEKNNKIIREFIYFWIFDLHYLPKENDKSSVINNLKKFNRPNNKYFLEKVNLNYIIKRFKPYEYLLNSLIEDNFVSSENKEFVRNLLKEYNNKKFEE